MSLRRLVVLGAFVVVCCLFATPSQAQLCPDCGGALNPDDGFQGWEALEPGGYSPPTINSCTAHAGTTQRCRECAPAYYDNGTYKGYDVCAYVSHSASCSCDRANTPYCSGQGSCSYLYS